MKIIEQNENILQLKDGNISSIITGVILAVVGAVIGLLAQSSDTVVILIVVAFIAIGAALVLFSSSINIVIDKTKGQIVYGKKRIVGAKMASYQTANVFRIETRKEWRVQRASSNKGISMPRRTLVSQSFIVFKDGTQLPLGHQKSNSSGLSIGPAVFTGGSNESAIANQVAVFLGVPFEEINPPGGIQINLGGGGMG